MAGDMGATMAGDMGAEQGRASRLAEVYVRSAPAGFRLAYLLTGDRALAEDLVQEAFLRFVGRLHHLREPEAFDAYLRRTIVNLSKDVFRRRALERSYLERRTAELGKRPTTPTSRPTDRCERRCSRSRHGSARRSSCATTKISTSPRSPTCCDAAPRPCARSSRAGSRPSARSPR